MPVAARTGPLLASSLGDARVEDQLAIVTVQPDDALARPAHARADFHGLHALLTYARGLASSFDCHDCAPLPRNG
eukprot:6264935-Pyramimonas_sp.AAC.1